MPHIVLEASKNTYLDSCAVEFFHTAHDALVETGAFKSPDIKCRLITNEQFLVGNGQEKIGFAHVSVAILPGREPKLLKELSEKLLAVLRATLTKLHPDSAERFALSVEFRELHKETYSK